MKIGVLEICEKGHYMLSNALIKTYMSDKSNAVCFYTTREIEALIREQDNEDSRIICKVLEDYSDINIFFEDIAKDNLDRLHLASVTKHFKLFYKLRTGSDCRIYFHFHNVELWFVSAWLIQFKRLWKVFSNYSKNVNILRHLKYSLKDIWRDYYRKKFIWNIINNKCQSVILSEAQRFHLNKYFDASKAIVFPTLIFEPFKYKDLSIENTRIRICVPGSVSQDRREYFKLLEIIESNIEYYSANFLFDFLGFMPHTERLLNDKIQVLNSAGVKILTYDYFIDVNDFDIELYKCDFVLSNILLNDGEGVQNKETAAVYHMIRGAKPGLFPKGFQLDSDFKDTVLYFNDYGSLHKLFEYILDNKLNIINLKANALKVSLRYSPESLLNRLI